MSIKDTTDYEHNRNGSGKVFKEKVRVKSMSWHISIITQYNTVDINSHRGIVVLAFALAFLYTYTKIGHAHTHWQYFFDNKLELIVYSSVAKTLVRFML